ncbi:MAG: ABC transporter ATP-binding protein [Candidatus Omnitrophica bacterium]|nr:ABC transporter ATP-binding protein [Candidatus Omnitrophota bacterium]
MEIIRANNIWEMYKVKFIKGSKIIWENFWALRDISFSVIPGETVGVIGENGSGKSTLLKVIAGMLVPDRGTIYVTGKVTGLLEFGAGFETEMTGHQNILTIAGLYGLSQEKIGRLYDVIVAFADLGRFIDAPIRSYSQGMFVRLAFSLAVHIPAEIVLIDDTLSVGDEYFQRKCIKKIIELKESGKTMFFVTHDMSILSKLCDRVIFLKNGRLVADGSRKKIIPLYSKMIGEKQGIAVFEKGDVKIIFNNGKLFIYHRETLLTPHEGVYTVMHQQDTWSASTQGDWHIVSQDDERIIAGGELLRLDLTQVWNIWIDRDEAIHIDIEIESAQTIDLDEGYFNVMLSEEYVCWRTPFDGKKFPDISLEDKNWRPLLNWHSEHQCIAVYPGSSPGDNPVPACLVTQNDATPVATSQIYNTDYSLRCRVAQYKLAHIHNYSHTQAQRALFFSGKIIVGKDKADAYLKNTYEHSILNNQDMQIVFTQGECSIFINSFQKIMVGKINSFLTVETREYYSSRAFWKVEKDAQGRIIAIGDWPDLSIRQRWRIELTGKDSFSLKVKTENPRQIRIQEQDLRFYFSDTYQQFQTDYGRKAFPEEFCDFEVDVLQRCISQGSIGLYSRQKEYLPVHLENVAGKDTFAKIFNGDRYRKKRVINFYRMGESVCASSVEQEQDFNVSVCFPGHTPPSETGPSGTLQQQDLKFIFEGGAGQIYWQGQKLTKKLGFYSSLRLQGRWYDSCAYARWTLKKDSEGLMCEGDWSPLPLRQLWRLRLENSNNIIFQIYLFIDKPVAFDRIQANLMLSEEYDTWDLGTRMGIFPDFRGEIDDEWDIIACVDNREYDHLQSGVTRVNGPRRQHFPPIKVSSSLTSSLGKFCIVNSDLYHRGRILRFNEEGQKFNELGQYLLCEGNIVIDE